MVQVMKVTTAAVDCPQVRPQVVQEEGDGSRETEK